MTNKIVFVALLSLLSAGSIAEPGAMPSATEGLSQGEPEFQDGPALALKKGMGQMLEFLIAEQRQEPQAIEAFLHQEIAPYFDFAYMARSAAGPYYQQMAVEQRQRMGSIIEQQFLSTLAQRLAGFTEQRVKIVGQRINPDQRTGRVTVAVLNPSGYPARLDFRFYKAGDKWLVFDVMANGSSAVLFYRDHFRGMMRL